MECENRSEGWCNIQCERGDGQPSICILKLQKTQGGFRRKRTQRQRPGCAVRWVLKYLLGAPKSWIYWAIVVCENKNDAIGVGAHTIGIGPCAAFSKRLFNFTGKGDMDPSLDPTYAEELKSKCISLENTRTIVDMDPGSPLTFDSDYFAILKQHKGLFQSDATLLTNGNAAKIVNKQLNQSAFFENFKKSMRKMSEIQVLTGTAGEIRRHCAFVN